MEMKIRLQGFSLLLLISSVLLSGCSSGGGDGTPDPNPNPDPDPVTEPGVSIPPPTPVTVNYNVCTTQENGFYNGLGVSRFVRFNADANKSATITVSKTSGLVTSDPDLFLYKNGLLIGSAETYSADGETLTTTIGVGDYVLELVEYTYWGGGAVDETCYDIELSLENTVAKPVIPKESVTQKPETLIVQQAPDTTACTSTTINISGTATFDYIVHSTVTNGLNYDSIYTNHIKEAVIEVICGIDGMVYDSGATSVTGDFTLLAPSNQNFKVRVKAQMQKTGTNPSWDFKVVDNTNLQATYVMDLPVTASGTDLTGLLPHADSGWDTLNNTGYTGVRVAGPFAILDSVYYAYNTVLNADPIANFPPLMLNWSIANKPSSTFDSASGDILTSHFNGTEIYILGAEDIDTDEYDTHVIIHEWGHYFEEFFSRSDSIGGPHGMGDILDMRVAFGEGWGNALSAIVSGFPVYVDSYGAGQTTGFNFDIDSNSCINPGWYSECSVQAILYDLSSPFAGMPGFQIVYNVLTTQQKNTAAMTSIFSFIKPLKDTIPSLEIPIDILVGDQAIDPITDIYGDSELTNNPGFTNQLPVYQSY